MMLISENIGDKLTISNEDARWLQESLDSLSQTLDHPFAGFDAKTDTPVPSGYHLLVSASTGVGKSRRVLAPAALYHDGPVVMVSSKADLVAMVDLVTFEDIDKDPYMVFHETVYGGTEYLIGINETFGWANLYRLPLD